MSKFNVAVVFGGKSSEHEVSLNSAANIINSMDDEKYNIIPIYITRKGKWLLYEGSIENFKNVQFEKFGTQCILNPDSSEKGILRIAGNKIKNIPVDVIFPVLHGKNGEDGTVQGLFELSEIPYVGCGILASAAAMDKAFTKQIVDGLKINQAKYIEARKESLDDLEELIKQVRYKLGYPCFVKPSRQGSSVGVSKAKNKEELKKAIEEGFLYDSKLVIEKAVIGRELECAVLGSGGDDTIASGIGEILAEAEFYSYDAKYNDASSKTVLDPDIGEEKTAEIQKAAVDIFKALECSGLSRVDFFLEAETDKVIFNEINTLPGFTDISMYPMLINHMGIESKKLIDRLIEIAMERKY